MRIRITYSKTGALKYIGHLDLQTIWERAARRAGLPLAYTHGFHPQAKIQHAAALPLGFSSRCEVVDLRLETEVDLGDLPVRLQTAMPGGVQILKVESVADQLPPLQTQVSAAEYEVELIAHDGLADLQDRIVGLLASPALPRVRRGKAYDLRPLIEDLAINSDGVIFMRLSAREAATGRPEEVLDALGLASDLGRIERTRLIFQ